MALRANDRASWLNTIWEAIHELEACQPDTGMDDVKTAMAWVTETLGLELDSNGDYIDAETPYGQELCRNGKPIADCNCC
jgi:hypothetical protein